MGSDSESKRRHGMADGSIERSFNELAGMDGDATINLSELYVGILLVYNDVNKYAPGSHFNPPTRAQVEEMLKEFDTDKNGVLDRDEFRRFVHKFMPDLAKHVAVNVLVVCAVVPSLVWLTRKAAEPFPEVHKVVKRVPGALLGAVFSLVFKLTRVVR